MSKFIIAVLTVLCFCLAVPAAQAATQVPSSGVLSGITFDRPEVYDALTLDGDPNDAIAAINYQVVNPGGSVRTLGKMDSWRRAGITYWNNHGYPNTTAPCVAYSWDWVDIRAGDAFPSGPVALSGRYSCVVYIMRSWLSKFLTAMNNNDDGMERKGCKTVAHELGHAGAGKIDRYSSDYIGTIMYGYLKGSLLPGSCLAITG